MPDAASAAAVAANIPLAPPPITPILVWSCELVSTDDSNDEEDDEEDDEEGDDDNEK